MILEDHCTILQTLKRDVQEYGIMVLEDRCTILQTLKRDV